MKRPLTAASETPAAGRAAEKYERILDAAIAVIAENGYFNSPVSKIAERAGVADGTVYLYFKSKEQILMAALEKALATFLEGARQELQPVADPKQRLRRLARLHFESLAANRNLAVVLQIELRQSAKFLAEFSHRHLVEYFNLIRSIIREGQESGAFRRDISEKIAANCYFGALDEMATSWVLSERDYSLPNMADAVVDLLVRGMENRADV